MTIALGGADLELVRERFDTLARVECAGRSPLWAEVCRAVAGDDATLELMLCAPQGQRRPTLLLAAIHDLLLSGVEHELAAHVPTVAGGAVAAGRAGDLALAFCREHRDALAHVLATRSTQNNEVNRVATLLPALSAAMPPGRPLRLVEAGASAGLNLLADRYAVRYRTGGDACAASATAAAIAPCAPWPSASTVVCDCAIEGALPPLVAPSIAERIGIDLDPVDVRDDEAARWLVACVWPDEADRVARLRAAIALARADPPRVVRGDALALLPAILAEPGPHPVVWHSWVLAYSTPDAQRALAATIDAAGAQRDLTWLYLEQPSETPGLPTPVVAGTRHDPGDSALVAVRYRDGVRTAQRLADAHPHAHRMRWLA